MLKSVGVGFSLVRSRGFVYNEIIFNMRPTLKSQKICNVRFRYLGT